MDPDTLVTLGLGPAYVIAYAVAGVVAGAAVKMIMKIDTTAGGGTPPKTS